MNRTSNLFFRLSTIVNDRAPQRHPRLVMSHYFCFQNLRNQELTDSPLSRYQGYDVTLISWHHTIKSGGKNVDGPKGARITFIDRSKPNNVRYRHVLLVLGYKDSSGKANFRTQTLHAGGIMWYGNLLYVVDTRAGIRIFDMNHIYEVDDSGNGIGRVGTKYQAYGYKYD